MIDFLKQYLVGELVAAAAALDVHGGRRVPEHGQVILKRVPITELVKNNNAKLSIKQRQKDRDKKIKKKQRDKQADSQTNTHRDSREGTDEGKKK